MARLCECGATIPVQSGRGRPRSKCSTCAPPKKRAAQLTPIGPVREIRPGASVEVPTVLGALLAELRRLDAMEVPEAPVLVSLARRIDDGAHTAAQHAQLTKEYRAALDAVRVVAAKPAAAVDDGVAWDVG